MSNVLAYSRGSHNLRAGFDLRRLATGRRAANDPRGLFYFTGDMTGHAVADFMLGAAAHGHPADRPDPGPRRPVAQRLLRQRHMAGDART